MTRGGVGMISSTFKDGGGGSFVRRVVGLVDQIGLQDCVDCN